MVSRAIGVYNKAGGQRINEVILHTGQHFEWNISNVFFEELDIPKPNYNLGINSGSHGSLTGRMMEKIEAILKEVKPNWILVYGDTNTTLAGTLAAKKLHLNIAHIEAGLRSFNIRRPEEQNRLVTDRLSDLLFCPTEVAMNNLMREGIGSSPYGEMVANVGDVMYDALLYYSDVAEQKFFDSRKVILKTI
jgi:UDP-GlcNAc3NAcA epimerase